MAIEDGHVIGFLDDTVPPPFLEGPKEPQWSWDPGKVGFGFYEPPNEPVSRSLVTGFPERVELGTSTILKVSISAAGKTDAGPLAIAVPIGSKIDIVVEPESGFELEGPDEGNLVVSDEKQTLPLRFKLKAVTLGQGKIRIYAYQGVQPLGVMTVSATVVSALEIADTESIERERPLVSVSVHQPDLALYIFQHKYGGHPGFTMKLTALDPSLGLDFKTFGPVPFNTDPAQYFKSFFEEIKNLRLDKPEERETASLILNAKGAHLFETLFPPDLQVLLWSLKERIQTIQILSQEPWIPWELCKLTGQEKNGQVMEGPFLCEAFSVTRWIHELNPRPDLTLKNIAVVVPKGSGLKHAVNERDYLLSLKEDGREVKQITARLKNLIHAMSLGIYDGWHFTGHGTFRVEDPNRSGLKLENRERLTPEYLSGIARRLGRMHPLVFLNACDVGQRAMSLTDIGGFAHKFLWAGAGAFVGAHWAIDDQIAYNFAQEFYTRLLGGFPVGQAIRASRIKIRDDHPGDPTWLAYTVFADPFARVKL